MSIIKAIQFIITLKICLAGKGSFIYLRRYIFMRNLKHITILFGFLCTSLSVLSQPANFSLNKTSGCDSVTVEITDLSNVPVGLTPDYEWRLNGKLISTSENFNSFKADSTVIINLRLAVSGATTEHQDTVFINKTPNAYFTLANEGALNVMRYTFRAAAPVHNNIKYTYTWLLNKGRADSVKIIKTENKGVMDTLQHTFATEGLYSMQLTVNDSLGCKNSYSTPFSIAPDLIIPEVFTPNNDGMNDYFYVPTNGRTDFSLQIFSSHGNLVFRSKAKSIIWDGKTMSGDEALPGTYYYIIESLNGDFSIKKKGYMMLLRKR